MNYGKGKDQAILLGNEAIARGALEAGVDFCTAYPGTPSTEIMEALIGAAEDYGHYTEWSTNEKVALEVAGAAASTGLRALCTMKCQGLDVASDFLQTASLAGTNGGFVLAVADDPGAHSTTTEFDTRHFAKMADLPLLEPSRPREARKMAKEAFEISEELEVIVILRTLTRISHSSETMKLGEISENSRTPEFSNDEWYTSQLPLMSHSAHHQKMKQAENLFENSKFNKYIGPEDADFVIMTTGLGWPYSLEGVKSLNLEDEVGVLKIGTGHPLPEELVKKHLLHAGRVLFVEEIDPFLEENVRSIAGDHIGEIGEVEFFGKKSGHIKSEDYEPGVGEIDPKMVLNALNDLTDKDYQARPKEYSEAVEEFAEDYAEDRMVSFCAGCPHRASFWAVKRALEWTGEDNVVAGDIGCYAMGMGPSGYFLLNTLHCMGAGIGVAHGYSKLKDFDFDRPVVAFAGDSTFYHACLPGLINAKYNDGEFLLVVLDNETTAMTGHQPHPGTGVTATGEESVKISPETITEALDIPTVIKDPFDVDETTEAAYDLLQKDGVKVLILRHPCELKESRGREVEWVLEIDEEKCIGDECGCARFLSREFDCPGLVWNSEEGICEIDKSTCTKCGLCVDLCPGGAIEKKEVKE